MSDTFVLAARLRATKLRGIYGHVDHLTAEAADALTAQAATIAEQAAQIEALRADAERYRWLRDEDDDPCLSLVDLFTTTGKREDVDAAIDAAMQSGKAAEPMSQHRPSC